MKLTVIGLRQCGCRIADQFARLNVKARGQRKATIAPTVIAANTDQADLTGLRFISNETTDTGFSWACAGPWDTGSAR
jgi:cell division GTPase FtsZ